MSVTDFATVVFPWPESATSSQVKAAGAALKISVSENPLAAETELVNNTMELLSNRIERFAPGAPVSAKREAARRYYGYLNQMDGGTFGNLSVGGVDIQRPMDHGRAFRLSGALSVLSPYRVRLAVNAWDEDQ